MKVVIMEDETELKTALKAGVTFDGQKIGANYKQVPPFLYHWSSLCHDNLYQFLRLFIRAVRRECAKSWHESRFIYGVLLSSRVGKLFGCSEVLFIESF